jgi:hypothetical protein
LSINEKYKKGTLFWGATPERISQRKTLKEYARLIENRIVYSYNEHDKSVYSRAMEEVHFLKESGNREFQKGNLKVHCFFYQSNRITEKTIRIKSDNAHIKCHLVQCSSYDRFILIVSEWQEKDNAKQHEHIATESGSWYIRNPLGQE